MAATRRKKNVMLQFDDKGTDVESLEIRTIIEMTDPDTGRTFVSGEAVYEVLEDLTQNQRDAISALVVGVVDEILERKSPLVTE